MVEVEMERKEGRIVSFTISGHANSGPHGHDLVCAGISAVSIGTENAVESLCGVQLVTDQNGKDGGYLRCTVPDQLDGQTEEKVQLLLEGMVVSIKAIVHQYGKYIRFKD